MGWIIQCCDEKCAPETWASNIVDLIDNHCDEFGWGETWEPYLKGIIPLSYHPEETYQPFVFLVSNEPYEEPKDVWFSYYKDTRSIGGRLKLGYGPGGPPVLGAEQVVELIKMLIERGCLDKNKVLNALDT